MARGYSASRSKSLRPTLRQKRQRSLSLHVLQQQQQQRQRPTTAVAQVSKASDGATGAETSATTRDAASRTRSGSTLRRTRAASLMRRQLEAREEAARRGITRHHSHDNDDEDEHDDDVVRSHDEDDEYEDDDENARETIARPDVMTKYKTVGRIVDEVLDVLAAACVAGANTHDLCTLGDREALARLQGVFAKTKDADGKRLVRGLSYPTNVSVNEVVCNCAPFRREDGQVLHGGDVVKLHLGCHLDGYPVSAARTVLVPAHATSHDEKDNNSNSSTTAKTTTTAAAAAATTRRAALTRQASNAVEAARVALLGMVHLLRPGTVNGDVTDFVARVGGSFGVEALEGVLSHRIKRWVVDGVDCIIARRVCHTRPQQDVAECRIGAPQVWTLDVAFTNHPSSFRTAVAPAPPTSLYRRTPAEFALDARVQGANAVLREITDTHYCFPFYFGALARPLHAKLGVGVLLKHGVVDALPVLQTASSSSRCIAARFSATVAVTARRVTVLCGLPPLQPLAVADELLPLPVPDDVAAVLARPLTYGDGKKSSHTVGGDGGALPARKRARHDDDDNSHTASGTTMTTARTSE